MLERVGVAIALVLAALLAADLLRDDDESAVRFGPREPVDPALAADVEAKLREFGRDRFDVVEVRVIDGQPVGLTEYFYETRLYAVSFDARVRMTRDVEVRSVEQSIARQGGAGWTREEMLEDVLLRETLGAGKHPAGGERPIEAAAWYLETEPGRRFHLIGARHDGKTLLRRGTKGSR